MESYCKYKKDQGYDFPETWKDFEKKHKFIYDGIELEVTNAFSYLGIVFSPTGLFNKAQRQL